MGYSGGGNSVRAGTRSLSTAWREPHSVPGDVGTLVVLLGARTARHGRTARSRAAGIGAEKRRRHFALAGAPRSLGNWLFARGSVGGVLSRPGGNPALRTRAARGQHRNLWEPRCWRMRASIPRPSLGSVGAHRRRGLRERRSRRVG